MASYGRNFDFRVPPEAANRLGRFELAGAADVPIGAPVKTDTNTESGFPGTNVVRLATGAQAPVAGLSGIVVFEHIQYQGDDPYLTTYSDKDKAPVGKLVQVVAGPDVKVVFTNTVDRTFLNTRDYAGRVMVAGLGATPTLAVGDMLTPGTGNDTAGYWAETADATKAWLRVTAVDNDRGEVEAQFLF